MKTKTKIIDYFNELPEVKRLKALEPYIKNNEDINNKYIMMKDLQKKMVASREFDLINQYNEYKKEYEKIKNELLDMPFVEEYLELVDEINQLLNNLSDEINYLIDKEINN